MRLYGYNSKFVIVRREDGLYVIYSSYTNDLIAVSEEGKNLFDQLITMLKKQSGEVFVNSIDKNMVELIDILIDRGFLFLNKEQMESKDYIKEYTANIRFHPHKAYLHLTQRCNLNCKYCYNKQNLYKFKELSTSEWISVIDLLAQNKFDSVVFTGGETVII